MQKDTYARIVKRAIIPNGELREPDRESTANLIGSFDSNSIGHFGRLAGDEIKPGAL